MQIGYCGNVHPGRTIAEVKQNLAEFSLAVKQQFSPEAEMGIGLWLSATAARELADPDQLTEFRDWLREVGLLPFTFNGFPFGDFHQSVVKHQVYLPTWAENSRLDYTVRLAKIQHALLPEGMNGTISTLPLGWPGQLAAENDRAFLDTCAGNLRKCAASLHQIQQQSGRNIFVCIEPEPGCLIDTCEDLCQFFEEHLLTQSAAENEITLKHVGVCHDICHSAVMFEDQSKAISSYRAAGIRVGKIQVSSAIEVDFNRLSKPDHAECMEQLRAFAEPRYLHQTCIHAGQTVEFYEDLPLALEENAESPFGRWRVHFHVPIFSDHLDRIGTTQSEIHDCLAAIQPDDNTTHFEVETYAWNVLPEKIRVDRLADGIARELKWFESQLN